MSLSAVGRVIREGALEVGRIGGVHHPRSSDVDRYWPLKEAIGVPVETYTATPTVYRLFGAGGILLYVGVTGNVGSRLAGHARTQPWWPEVERVSTQCFATRELAAQAEGRAIATEDPLYNGVLPESGRRLLGRGSWIPVRLRQGVAS